MGIEIYGDVIFPAATQRVSADVEHFSVGMWGTSFSVKQLV